jgi:thermitase
MKKTIAALAVAILLISSFPTIVFATPPDNQSPVTEPSSEQILVKFKPGTSLPEVDEIHRQLGGKVKKTIPGIGVQVVTVPKGQAKEKAKAYSSNPRVAYAEPDFVAQALGSPNDPFLTNQWGLTKVGAPQAWDVTTGSASINIAILDTGVDPDHPDLASKIVSNINFSGSDTVDDVFGHGTHVAGIAAASTNNGAGVAGLGYAANIMNVKVLADNGAGAHSAIAAGIIWAADNGAQIINMSFGGGGSTQTLEDAVNYAWSKGVVVVAAAGNNGNSYMVYPAGYADCIAVAATDRDDARASWSNYGDWVDVAAPGTGIYSTIKGDSYGYKSGTSMASPHVAGLAALVFTAVSDTNRDGKLNDEVRSRIETTCDDIGVTGIGHGRINAAGAVGSVPVLPGKISGQVTDTADGSLISVAQVSDGTRAVLTDAAGQYAINDVPPGIYQVVANKEGYQSSSLSVTVVAGSTAVANLPLTEIIVPGSITGTVTSAKDGSAIVGATVTDGTRTTTTDATGKYTISNVPPGTYQVAASKSGYYSFSSSVTVVAGTTTVANFPLTEIIVPGSISGTVTSAKDGSPIVGATVTDGTRTTTTDSTGKYTISNVPPGTYQVTASKAGYHSSTVTVTVLAGSTVVANFSLIEIIVPGSISGTVTSAKDGSPVVGATVSDGTRTTTTDATGRYTIANVPPGTYQVTAGKSGYYSLPSSVTVLAGATGVANFSLIEVPGAITGTVTSAKDGSPVVGATVTDGTRTTTTDGTGKYTISNVPPDTYQVVASKSGYHSSSLGVTVLAGNAAVANFALNEVIVPGSISGTVTSAKDGSPIVGAMVSDGTRTTTTDATGKYTISNVPPGTYQVTASKAGYYSSSSSVTVVAGAAAVANFALNEIPGSISGTVTSAKDGSPIVGATVTDGARTTSTDATGKYTIASVPPGTYQVTASKEGYASVTSAVTVASGGTVTINFSLSPRTPAMWVDSIRFIKNGKNLVVEVRVVTASGVLPGANVGLRVECSSGRVWSFSGITDTAGLVKVKVSKAPAGSYQAIVTSLVCSGFTWDTSKGITATSYVLSR